MAHPDLLSTLLAPPWSPVPIDPIPKNQMPLAQIATVAIPPIPNVALTCHVATWYWAARTAQEQGLSVRKDQLAILGNIATMRIPPQAAILGLARSGNWNFSITPTTPPLGTVLLWPNRGTHSAVVTRTRQISGYNQSVQFPHLAGQFGLTIAAPDQLAPAFQSCVVVSEETIVRCAGQLNL